MPVRKKVAQTRTLAIHRTFDKDKKGDPIYFVAETGEKVKKLAGIKLDAFLKEVDGKMRIRVTSTGYFLPILASMQKAGAIIESAHWHATGIPKGAEPEVIVQSFVGLPQELMRPVQLREDLHTLRQMVSARAAYMEFRKAATLKTKAIARSMGYADDDQKPKWLTTEEEAIDQLAKDNERPVEKEIAKLAATITECVILNEVLGVKGSWGTAASVVSYLGDPARFGSVSSLWHYSGFHVVGGRAPKRQRGQNITWNPNLRTALWLWADSMLKSRNPIWRPVYDQYLAEELAIHLEKHPGCTTVQGHSGARARRRVIKDVLKEFYRLTVGGKDSDHRSLEDQSVYVAVQNLAASAALSVA